MTDMDYKDMVDPYVRSEVEAFRRGYGEGVVSGIWYTIVAIIAAGLVLVAWNAHASEAPPFTVIESARPIKASEHRARITVCSTVSARMQWSCFIVR